MYLSRINFYFSGSLIRNKKEAKEYVNDVINNFLSTGQYKLKVINVIKLRKKKKEAKR